MIVIKDSFDNKDEFETVEKLMKLMKENFWSRLRVEKSTIETIVTLESLLNKYMELKKDYFDVELKIEALNV